MTDIPSARAPEVRVSNPPLGGFIVWQDGEPVAAFAWRHELADWLLDHFGAIPGEREREARALAAPPVQPDNDGPFPRVVSPRSEPRRSRFFGG